MPIYEYHCQKCGHHFDVLQKVDEAPVNTCPECKANQVTKLVSAAGFQLKGSGWYATDFKNKPSTPSTQTAEAAKTSSSTEAKGDTKA